MYRRAFIREGDTLTPGGGRVQPVHQQYPTTYDGKSACYERDPVYCNVCKSWGVTQCVPPFRPHTDPLGRQANLDGDLCICKCPTPPRLKALFDNMHMDFDQYEVANMAGAMGWVAYAGHTRSWTHHDQHFLIEDATGAALIDTPYRITLADGTVTTGRTDDQGKTERIFTFAETQLKIEAPYYGDSNRKNHADDESDACSC